MARCEVVGHGADVKAKDNSVIFSHKKVKILRGLFDVSFKAQMCLKKSYIQSYQCHGDALLAHIIKCRLFEWYIGIVPYTSVVYITPQGHESDQERS